MSALPVTSSAPTTARQGTLPIIQGDGGLRYVLDRIQGLVTSIQSLVQGAIQNAFRAPSAPTDGMIRLARYPWWPVAGQAADAWVYYDQAGGVWRLLSTAPTSIH